MRQSRFEEGKKNLMKREGKVAGDWVIDDWSGGESLLQGMENAGKRHKADDGA